MAKDMGCEEPKIGDLLSLLAEYPDDEEGIREKILRQTEFLIDEAIEEDFSSSGFSHEAMYRAGYIGLINATYNLEFSGQASFYNYAKSLIKGEIREHIRSHVKHAEFPDWIKGLNRNIEEAQVRLLRQLNRLPSLAELSDALNLTEEAIAEVLKAREALNYISIDEARRESDPLPVIDQSKIRNKEPEHFPVQYRIRIADALEKFGQLEQYLLRRLFSSTSDKQDGW
jgi:DNA-directed RNA polymerase specialized sigma subunit